VRLVPADPARERQFADLIAAWEILCADQERLFHQILAVLREESGRGGPEHEPSRSPDL
jgi:hypothetical protein